MSTIAIDYPNSLQDQRTTNFRLMVVILVGLVLVASVVLVAAAASAKVDPLVGAVAVPVAPLENPQIPAAATATPAPRPVVIAVPVATPPSQ
jgi:hypothetical protein